MNVTAQPSYDRNAAFDMLHTNASTASNSLANAESMITIKTRFGEISVEPSKAINFPRGLLGMPDKARYALAGFPGPKMAQFKLLQSLDDHTLSFITLPLDVENSILSTADIRQAATDLQIKEQNLALLLIVSVHRNPDAVRLSVNARAPLFIDAERKLGVQYVFQSDNYKVQHMLG